MRKTASYIVCAAALVAAAIIFAPRQFLQYKYRAFLSEKHGRLVSPDSSPLGDAFVVATWRSASFGWKTSYWCDMQTVVHPDASGAYVIPDASQRVDVSKLWFSRLMGLEVDFSWDLFVYKPGYIPSTASLPGVASRHSPWSLASTDVSPTGVNIYPIKLQPVSSNPEQALDYYASYLQSLDCGPNEAAELAQVRRKAHVEAVRILCTAKDPTSVDRNLASKIIARPVGLISLGGTQPTDTMDIRSVCESLAREDGHE